MRGRYFKGVIHGKSQGRLNLFLKYISKDLTKQSLSDRGFIRSDPDTMDSHKLILYHRITQ